VPVAERLNFSALRVVKGPFFVGDKSVLIEVFGTWVSMQTAMSFAIF
jgi:hypothetical protein